MPPIVATEHPSAHACIDSGAERAFGISNGREFERATVEISALGITRDHAAGIARAKKKRAGAADGFNAFNVKRV
jgi:hypothetical protein